LAVALVELAVVVHILGLTVGQVAAQVIIVLLQEPAYMVKETLGVMVPPVLLTIHQVVAAVQEPLVEMLLDLLQEMAVLDCHIQSADQV
jgi:hypothetical protein